MINLEELARFLVKAKKGTYAGDGKEITPERPGFKELEYIEGDWNYRDSYIGFFMAPGQEVVRFQGKPIWVMSYSGGMTSDFKDDINFAKETFNFLKRALLQVSEEMPFRGPKIFSDEKDWHYQNYFGGDVTNFHGHEKIYTLPPVDEINRIVFAQDYIGGLVLPKILELDS